MLEFEHLPSVTKKQKRLSTIVSIIVSISVSVISGRLMAKTAWKRVKNRVKESLCHFNTEKAILFLPNGC